MKMVARYSTVFFLILSCLSQDTEQTEVAWKQQGFPTLVNQTLEFSMICRKNQTGHWITQVSVLESSPILSGNLKVNFKSSVTQIGGVRSFNIQGTVSVPPQRPADYEFFPNIGYYKFYPELKVTYDEALAKCSIDGAHLVIINSDAEYKALQTIFSHYPNAGTSVFVGFNDRLKEGDYITIFGQPLNSTGWVKWAPGDPNNYGGNQNCGCLVRDSFLCDVGCEEKQPFFCEFDLSWG